jgi:uncharacterized cupredoxin-like copper-binding protein
MKKAIVLVAGIAALVGSLLVASASAHTQAKAATKVTVTMTDFHFKITIPKGQVIKHGVFVTFKVVNKGGAVHNFDLQQVKASKIIAPGKTTTIKVKFKKKGKFPYVCDVPRHAELGMAGTLKVA